MVCDPADKLMVVAAKHVEESTNTELAGKTFDGGKPRKPKASTSEIANNQTERRKFMKLGFISLNLPGHLNPMTALARQLQARNHEVVFL